jgi:hypothetical protein
MQAFRIEPENVGLRKGFLVDISCSCGTNGPIDMATKEKSFKHRMVIDEGRGRFDELAHPDKKILICSREECGKRFRLWVQDTHLDVSVIQESAAKSSTSPMRAFRIELGQSDPRYEETVCLIDITCECAANGPIDEETKERSPKHRIVIDGGRGRSDKKTLACSRPNCGKRFRMWAQNTHMHVSNLAAGAE